MSIKEQVEGLLNEEVEAVVETTEDTTTLDIKEDIDALLSGETLSEEFKEKTATIFEAAVLNRVKLEVAKLEEKFNADVESRVNEIKEGLVDNIDGFLSYMTEQWIKDNEVALEVGIKTEITENFISGLKSLFAESYIEVPEDKLDVLADMQEKLEKVEGKLTEAVEANIELVKTINEGKKAELVAKLAEGLTDVDAEKFKSLSEELKFEDAETFEKKLTTIKESYFKVATVKEATIVESVVSDEPLIEETTKVTKAIDPRVALIAESMKTTKTKGSK